MKKIVTFVLSSMVVGAVQAQTPTDTTQVQVVNSTDTTARDLSDLEKKMAEEEIAIEKDTTYYGSRKQKDFNALAYSLDGRHRYEGDKWVKGGGFGKHTFLDFGAGVVFYQHNNTYELTPQAGIHVRLGKDLSPMSTFRIGVGGELGYVSGEPNVNWTMRADADYLFNFSNYLLGFRPDRPLSVSGILGVGVQQSQLTKYEGSDVAKTMRKNAFAMNVHTGLQFKFLAGTHAALAVEPYIMAGTKGMDLVKGSKFNHFGIGYGVNLSYIWYFYNNMSSQRNAGDFKRRFLNGERLFIEDPNAPNWRRPWFFEYSIGPSFYQRTPLKLEETLGYSISASVGQWMSSAIGMRGGVTITNAAWTKGKNTTSLLGKSGVFVDAMLNPFGFSRHYRWDSPVGVNLFAGYEMGKLQMVHADVSDKTSGNYAGYRIGGQFWAKLTNDLRLTFEPSYVLIEHFDRPDGRVRYDQMDMKMGVSVLFRDKYHRNYELTEEAKNDLPETGFFVGAGLGWNTTVNKWRYTEKNRGLLLNANGFVGYNFNMYHAAKLMVDYVTNPIWNYKKGNEYTKFTYENTFVSADYQLNLLNAMTGYRPGRRWNVSVYGGPSLVLSKYGKKVDLGANIGGMLSYRVLPYLSLYYSHTVYWMPSEHYDSGQIYTTPGAVSNVLNVGAMYNLDGFFKTIKNLPWKSSPNSGRYRFFLDYGYGYGYFPMLPNKAKDSWGSTMQLSLGWWGNSFLGARVGFNMAKGSDLTTTNVDGNKQEELLHGLGMATLTGDLLFNPLGLNKNYSWKSLVGGHLVLGYQNGLLVLNDEERTIKGSKITVDGFRLGVQFWVRLSRDLRFNIEPMYATLNAHDKVFTNNDGSKFYRTEEIGTKPLKLGNTFSVKLGLSVLLNRFNRFEDANLKSYADKAPNRFFASVGGGWNILLSKHRYKDGGTKMNLTAFGGYRLNEVSALRLGLDYVMDDIKYGYIENGSTELIEEKRNILFVAVDFQVDVLAYFRGYNPKRKWNLNLYTGPAIGIQIDKEHTKAGAINLGMTLDHRLNKRLSAFYNHNIFLLGFMGNKDLLPGTTLFGNITALNAINFGLMYNF